MKDQTGENCIRLVLLDNQLLFREAIARLLAAESDFEVVGECGTADEGMEMLRATTVDVGLLDFDLAVGHQQEGFMSAVCRAGYCGRFLVVAGTAHIMRNTALALKLGASGVVLKSEPPERLVQAIRHVAGGALWLDEKVIHRLADRFVRKSSVMRKTDLAAI